MFCSVYIARACLLYKQVWQAINQASFSAYRSVSQWHLASRCCTQDALQNAFGGGILTLVQHNDLFHVAADRMPSAKHLEEANAALTQWLSPEHCGHLVSAVISKYIALTPEELQEWQVSTFFYFIIIASTPLS